ncbi:MAG: MGMT family protein [Minisyncoccia bacterium]
MIKQTFGERVLDLAQSICSGETSTYGDIARAAGGGGQAARSVSGILGKYYKQGITDIPFHRIVYSSGQVWKSPQYNSARNKLYKKEGIKIDEKGFIVDFESRRKEF